MRRSWRDALTVVSAPAVALVPTPTDVRDGRSWHRLRALHLLILLAVAFNLWSLRAERLTVAYPNDSAMHLQMSWLAGHLLESGHSPFDHWYPLLSLGSAFFVQYQSLSAVVTGALGLIFGTPVTFAATLYLLLSLWPTCVYWSARLLAWGRWESAIAAALSPLIFTVTGRGFAHQSYIWIGSGLWSQLWAMWTLPVAWAFSWRYVSQRRSLLPAIVTLGLTIALHFLTAYLAGLSLIVWVLISPRQLLVRTGRALRLGAGALAVSAWVTLPLILHARWLAVNEFQVGTTIDDSYGARRVLSWLVTGQIYDWHRFPIITVLTGIGLVVCVTRWRHDERARGIVGVWLVSLLLFFGRPTLGSLLTLLPGSRDLLLQRYVMGVHLAGLMLAGVGAVAIALTTYRRVIRWNHPVMEGLRGRWRAATPWLRRAISLGLVVAVLAPAWTQIATYDGYSRHWIAYQRGADSTAGADVDSLVATAESRGGGRIYAGMPSNWGHRFYVGAVPVYIYLEQLNVDAVGFTLRTSGLMTDPEAYFDENVLGDFAALGVHYLILPANHPPPVPAVLLRARGAYRLWRVGTSAATALIQVVDTLGVITADNANLGPRTDGFLRSSLPGRGVYPTIAFAGQSAATPTLTTLTGVRGAPGVVLSQGHDLVDAQSARATVVARRPAVVLLKVAYDPGWRVTVDGRPSPLIMLAPALMGVEVAPGRHEVVFTYHGFAYYGALVALALVTLVGVACAPWWRRRRRARHALDRP